MDIERAKELLPIIQAFAEGKKVEMALFDGYGALSEWSDVFSPTWSDNYIYRIKPEPKYRPFKDAKECIEEMKKHEPFGWVKDKPGFGDKCSAITEVSISSIRRGVTWFCTNEMFQYVTFLDGSPFGVKVEDKEE